MLMKLRSMMQRREGQKGFTLIELVVVMAILAVLAALAVPRIATVLATSKFKAHNSNLELIAKAAELYYDTEDQLPANMASLTSRNYLKTNPEIPHTSIGTGSYSLATTVGGVIISPGSCIWNGNSASAESTTTVTF